jgi:Peptidase propeptide and YPEB domain
MLSTRTLRLGLVTLGFTAAVAVTAAAALAQAHGDPKLAALAKITPDAARVIATRALPGTIKDWELEKEAGGSGLRYSFDIIVSGKKHEVGVDAADGRILENGIETAADEARESKADKAKGKEDDDDDDDEDEASESKH